MNLTLREYAERATELLTARAEFRHLEPDDLLSWTNKAGVLLAHGIPADSPDAPRRFRYGLQNRQDYGVYMPASRLWVLSDGTASTTIGRDIHYWLDTPPPAPDSALVAALREKGVDGELLQKVKELEQQK